jgi:glycerol transport system permease protein
VSATATWYLSVLSSSEFWWALARSLGFSALVLLIEVPLGIWIALKLPPLGALVLTPA